jgi:uncharacterized protein YlxW (UPF0749 family)
MPDDSTPDDRAPRRAAVATDGRRRLLHSLVKPGKGQLIAAAMLFVVGMAGVMQIRSNTQDSTYASARREDLVVLLDGLNDQQQRLEREQADLERTRSELQSGADSQRAARTEARQRLDDLSILAGTAPAIEVIGDPHSLDEAAQFRGGIVSEITGPRIGGQVQIEQLSSVVIDSLHVATKNQYARPASPQPTPR